MMLIYINKMQSRDIKCYLKNISIQDHIAKQQV